MFKLEVNTYTNANKTVFDAQIQINEVLPVRSIDTITFNDEFKATIPGYVACIGHVCHAMVKVLMLASHCPEVDS